MSSASSSPRTEHARDPLRAWQRRLVASGALGLALVLASASFAIRLPNEADGEAARGSLATAPKEHAVEPPAPLAAVDRAAFDRRLWSTLTLPDADAKAAKTAAQAAAPALPLELDLVGVTSVDGVLVAALYDRRADLLRLVRQGERVLDADVEELSAERVRLTRGGAELVLVRRRPGS